MSKFCSNCGKPLKQEANFCGNCGAKVVRKTSAQENSQENFLSENSDLLLAGGAAMLSTALMENQASAQQTAMNPVAAVPPSGDVNNFFGLASNNLQEITGSVDVTNIVAHVAHSVGVQNIAEYTDAVTDTAGELIDNAADIVGDVAGEAAGEAAGNIIGSLLDLI